MFTTILECLIMKISHLLISLKGRDSWKRSYRYSIPHHLLAVVLLFIILTPSVFAEMLIEKIYDFNIFGEDNAKLTIYNNQLYFAASDGNSGLELWRSDGTPAGTDLVKDINPTGDSSPTNLFVYNNQLYFGAEDGNLGNELWVSDGTSPGTFLIKDINPKGSSSPGWLTPYHDQFYFSANDGGNGGKINRELWVSDGTTEGTQLFKDLNLGNSDVTWLTVYKDKLYFNASYGTNPKQFWVSDGADAQLLKDIPNGLYDPQELITFQDKLYFKANDQVFGHELWVMDGTFEGTHLVKDIHVSTYNYTGSDLSWLTIFNNRLYFRANDQITGQELWTSDGTEEGTQLLKDINLSPGRGSMPEWFALFNHQLFFTANDGIHGQEIWVTDGSLAGTHLFPIDVNPSGSSGAKWLSVLNNRLYFITSSPTSLWVLYEPVPPSIMTSPMSQTLLMGQSVTLSVIAMGDVPLSYQWYQGESGDISHPIPEATSENFTTPNLTTTTPYWVRVTNKVGSIDSITANIIVTDLFSPPDLIVDPPPEQEKDSSLPSPSSGVLPAYFTVSVEVHGPGKVTSLPVGIDCQWQDCQEVAEDATGMSCRVKECSQRVPTLSDLILIPHPQPRAIFSSWGGHPDCDDGIIAVRSSFVCIAYFHKLSKLTVIGLEHGTVISFPEGIQCKNQEGQCESLFEVGKEVQLSFLPETHWRFNGWSGACTQEGKVKINQTDVQCRPQVISIPQEKSSSTQDVPTIQPQEEIHLEHTTKQDPHPHPMTPQDDVIPMERLTMKVIGEGWVISESMKCGTECTQDYLRGTKVLLTAQAVEGSKFMHWSGMCHGETQKLEVEIIQATRCEAQFILVIQPPSSEGTLEPLIEALTTTVLIPPEIIPLNPSPALEKEILLPPEVLPPCLTKLGITTRVCHAGGQTVSWELEVHRGVSFSHAVLDNLLINEGWVSNLVITPRGVMTGGVVTGSISNQGVMRNFEFKGLSIVGGLLGGNISNHSQIGGYFQDVTLEAHTSLVGGKLQGLITGDPSAPALLENLKVGAGSQLKDVQLGQGVELESGVFLDKSVMSVGNQSISCRLLGIHDQGVSDTQFFSVDDVNHVGFLKVNPLGILHKNFDLEAFDVQPFTGKFYAASGDKTSTPGHLYLVNPAHGELTDLGAMGFKEVNALSFHPDGTLWGYATGKGLFTMATPLDFHTMKIVLPSREKLELEEISWNVAGTTLYGVQNVPQGMRKSDGEQTLLWAYHVEDGTFQVICDDLIHGMGKIEALETLPDDSIVLGFHKRNDLALSRIDVKNCQVLYQREIPTPYNDVEGIAWGGCSLKSNAKEQ